MTPILQANPPLRLTRFIQSAVLIGLAWNLFGVVQFALTVTASEAAFMARGMTPEQARLYAGLPAWMNLAFAAAVIGGSIGGLLLLLRRNRAALRAFALSLAGYGVLFAGDAALGIFAAFGAGQVAVLAVSIVVMIIMLALATRATRA